MIDQFSPRQGTCKPYKISKTTGAMTFLISLTLIPGRDDDLIAEMLATPLGQVAGKVREMMRNGSASGKFFAEQGGANDDFVVDLGNVEVEI